MLIRCSQQSDKLLFAGMAGGKCVTTTCNRRNTIGGCSVSLPRTDYGLYISTVGSGHAPTATYRRIRRTVIYIATGFSKNLPFTIRHLIGGGMPPPYSGVSYKQQFICLLRQVDKHLYYLNDCCSIRLFAEQEPDRYVRW